MSLLLQTEKPCLATLPENFIVQLDNCGAISLCGEEQSSYLQGQVTCDVNTLTDNNWLMGAHCNAKGKMFSSFRLVNHLNKHLLFQPNSTLEASLTELKKFGVFAKVEIEKTQDLAFFALVGTQISEQLKPLFGQLPDALNTAVSHDGLTLLYLCGERPQYILIGDKQAAEALVGKLSLPIYSSEVWTLLEIEKGVPFLVNTEQEYVPQMLNLQAVNGISFTKGCYLGQETVARMQYLGKNKKALYSLSANSTEDLTTTVIEKQLGENWRKAGDIISSYQSDNGQSYFQAVLARDTSADTNLRLNTQAQSSVTILPLPYSLSE